MTPKRYLLQLLLDVLGDGFTLFLFQRIRARKAVNCILQMALLRMSSEHRCFKSLALHLRFALLSAFGKYQIEIASTLCLRWL
jgi:hypothetical protein